MASISDPFRQAEESDAEGDPLFLGSTISGSSAWDSFSIKASSRLRCAIDPSKNGSMTVIEVLIEPIESMSLQFESTSREPSDWTPE